MEEENERILARRERIQKRIKAQRGEDINPPLVEFNQNAIEHQLRESSSVLENLHLESDLLVQNVRDAGETRKRLQIASDSGKRDVRQEDLSAEARASWQRIEAITAQWKLADRNNDALELNALLEEQKKSCEEVLEKKDAIIARLKSEILERDYLYQQTLNEQWEELKVATHRVDQQVEELQQTHRDELSLLEAVTSKCRADQIDLGCSRWEDLWENLRRMLNFTASEREQLREDLEADEDLLHDRLAQCLHEVRLTLQKQSQDLGLQLQELKASCILNAEKIKLNIEILKERDQEAKVLRAEQKKKISKLQDKLRSLQQEVRKEQQKRNYRRKNLSSRVSKLKAENLVASSSDSFNAVSKTQLKLLTNHYAKEITTLLKKIMALDETIHREQLCIPWSLPENFDSRLASLVHDLCDGRRSLASTKSSSSEALQEASSLLRRKDVSDTESVKRYILMKFLDSTIEFLAPENKDLQTDSREEKQLLDLSACLSALGVETESELDHLFNTLIQYTYCESCSQKPFDLNASCASHKPYLEGKSILIGLKKHFRANPTDAEDEASDVQSAVLQRMKSKPEEIHGWDGFLLLLPDDLEDKWDRLGHGLNQYLAVLNDRHEINTQVGRIKKQNAELRRLLEMHTMAKLLKKQQARVVPQAAD